MHCLRPFKGVPSFLSRWIVGVGRKQQDQTQDSDTSSDGEEPEPLDEDDMETRDHERPVKLEN